MTRNHRRVAGLLLAAAMLTGACSDGGEQAAAENPGEAFASALDALRDYEGMTLVMSLEADPEALVASGTPQDVAEALLNSSVTISGRGTTPEDSQAEIAFDVDGNEDAVEVRVVGESMYARAEVRDLVEAFDGDDAAIDAAVQQASAAGFDFAQPLVDGEWVGLEDFGSLMEQFGIPQPTPDPETATAYADRIVGILDKNADVTSEGTDDVGAHLLVSLPLKETVEEVFDALQELGGSAAAGALPPGMLDDVPDGDVTIDVWISDGRLVQVELDFVKIAQEFGEEPPEGVDEFALRITLDEFTDEVEAPGDFVEIDLGQIMQGMFGAMGGASESSGGAAMELPAERELVLPELGLACSDLTMFSPAEIKTFLDASGQSGAFKRVKQECPELF